jgi:hypothetical protein
MAGCAMNRRLLLLGSVAIVLALFLLWDRSLPVEERAAPAPAAERPQASAAKVNGAPAMLNPLQALHAGPFTAMLERPLFNPGRAERPPEPPPAPPPPPVEELPPETPPEPPGPSAQDFALIAVAAGPSGHVAAVRVAATGEVLYLREGQPVLTWNVMKVSDRSVVIGTPGSNVEITLFGDEAAAAPPATGQAPLPEQYEEYREPEINLNQDSMMQQ